MLPPVREASTSELASSTRSIALRFAGQVAYSRCCAPFGPTKSSKSTSHPNSWGIDFCLGRCDLRLSYCSLSCGRGRPLDLLVPQERSEERRVGKECRYVEAPRQI